MKRHVAVIGCGYWGKNLVRVFSQLGVLKCVCDANIASCYSIVEKVAPHTPVSDSLDKVLEDPTISAVAIATPAATHYQVARRCLEAGKDVFVEKPLALTLADGEKLVELADSTGRILMVGHILLYHPAVVKLRELIDQGALGRVLYCYSHRLNIGKIRTEENILWSFAPHDISVMLYLLGEEPVWAEAEGESYLTPGVVDVTLSRLRFQSGVTGHIFVSWLHPFKEQRFVVVGSEKMAVFDDQAEHKLVLYPHKVNWAGRRPTAVKAEPIPVEVEQAEPLRRECEHFLHCIETRQPPLSDGREGLRVLRVLAACQESLEENGLRRSQLAKKVPEGEYFVHETACVDEPCTIGRGTKIWHYSHIMAGAVIGENCSIGQNVFVGKGARIGNGVKIQNNVSVYDGVVLEDYVFCGPSCVFTNVINPRSEIERKNEYRPTVVKRGATIGANSTIICGHTIGKYAFVAAGAVVTKDVPDFALVAGVPARQIGWVSRAGHRLQFDENGVARCPTTNFLYKLVDGRLIELATGDAVGESLHYRKLPR